MPTRSGLLVSPNEICLFVDSSTDMQVNKSSLVFHAQRSISFKRCLKNVYWTKLNITSQFVDEARTLRIPRGIGQYHILECPCVTMSSPSVLLTLYRPSFHKVWVWCKIGKHAYPMISFITQIICFPSDVDSDRRGVMYLLVVNLCKGQFLYYS